MRSEVMTVAWALLLVCLLNATALAGEPVAKGYIVDMPRESAADREARHKKVAERRGRPIIMVHRGASAFAPENTLEAYAAAMDYGADGCEFDPRRTADGVIVLFHDDMLENLTNGFGTVKQLTYYELLGLKRRAVYGTANRETGVPTLVSFLALSRQRSMLLDFDFKEPGMAEEVMKLLDEADMWDQVVAVNTDNAGSMLTNSKLKMLIYKAPGMWSDRSDVDIDATKAALAQPGEMVIVDDPRVAAHILNRPAYQPVPIPGNLGKNWEPAHTPSASPGEIVPQRYIATLTSGLN